MEPFRIAAASLAGIAVICSLDLAGAWPLYLRLLWGAGMVAALLGAVHVRADDLPGWLLAVGVTVAVASVHGAIHLLRLPGAESAGVGAAGVLLWTLSLVVLGASAARCHQSWSSDHVWSLPGRYDRSHGAGAAPGRGR
jgi:hypothetical protein